MAITLPEPVKKILKDKTHGHITTFNRKGAPQVTLVWLDVEGDDVLFNTAEGRVKPRNLRLNPQIVISAQDPNTPRSYVVFYGTATVSDAGAEAHIDTLAKRFLGEDKYPFRKPGEKRLIVRTRVDRIGGHDATMTPWL